MNLTDEEIARIANRGHLLVGIEGLALQPAILRAMRRGPDERIIVVGDQDVQF